MKLYTIEEITAKLQEWRWSNASFIYPLDVFYLKKGYGDASDCIESLVKIYDLWYDNNQETIFFVINEGIVKFPSRLDYKVEIGMTNPAIEEYNSNRNLVV